MTQTVFHAFSASYMVDWNKDRNFMRAFLANDGYGLTAQWNVGASANGLLLQHMGLGETIGFANLISEVGFTGTDSVATWRGLLGDPTLRMHVVKPPSNVEASGSASDVTVSWSASPDAILGYNVYRATSFDSSFVLIGTTTNLSILDSDTEASPDAVYMVRAVKQESVPSGNYINGSQGAFSQIL
jgi:hypothetical protein